MPQVQQPVLESPPRPQGAEIMSAEDDFYLRVEGRKRRSFPIRRSKLLSAEDRLLDEQLNMDVFDRPLGELHPMSDRRRGER